MSRNALKVTITTSFEIPAPTNDELIELATDAGLDGDEPSDEELDQAYENWKEKIEEEYEEGKEPPAEALPVLDIEEVYK